MVLTSEAPNVVTVKATSLNGLNCTCYAYAITSLLVMQLFPNYTQEHVLLNISNMCLCISACMQYTYSVTAAISLHRRHRRTYIGVGSGGGRGGGGGDSPPQLYPLFTQ